jgi:hypothetical protein
MLRITMGRKFLENSRQIAAVMVVCGAAAAVYARPANDLVIVPPTNLPELAQHGGDAMLLRGTTDGRKLLYVEQDNGSHLATFDVTDPGDVKAKGSVQLEATGPFDFVSPIGTRAELIRFRRDQAGAILDFRKEKVPYLETIAGFTLPGPITTLGNDGFMVAGQAADYQSRLGYQVLGATSARDFGGAFDVKQVREEVTNADTGTTFLLAQGGLYEIRRPAVEAEKKRREKDWFEQHSGG